MRIAGFDKFSLLNYPGKMAATIFTAGCNLNCPFCHNMDTVCRNHGDIPEETVMKHLSKRASLLEGVCITGGEPTIHKDLVRFIKEIKKLGLRVKLDTNGCRPIVIKELLEQNLLDYIAMDIKTSLQNYAKVTGMRYVEVTAITDSINIIKSSSIDYEFRTTFAKGLNCQDEDIDGIGKLIQGAKIYYIQNFESKNIRNEANLSELSKPELWDIEKRLKTYCENVSIRGE